MVTKKITLLFLICFSLFASQAAEEPQPKRPLTLEEWQIALKLREIINSPRSQRAEEDESQSAGPTITPVVSPRKASPQEDTSAELQNEESDESDATSSSPDDPDDSSAQDAQRKALRERFSKKRSPRPDGVPDTAKNAGPNSPKTLGKKLSIKKLQLLLENIGVSTPKEDSPKSDNESQNPSPRSDSDSPQESPHA